VIETLDRIEAVIENAAVAGSGGKAEGHHLTLTVNVMGTFLLAMLLLPKLRSDSAKFGYSPRLSIVTSGTAFDLGDYWAKIAEDPIVNMNADNELGMKRHVMSHLFPLTFVEVLMLLHFKVLIWSYLAILRQR
jgi:hypothetical protein